jgi:serpin B
MRALGPSLLVLLAAVSSASSPGCGSSPAPAVAPATVRPPAGGPANGALPSSANAPSPPPPPQTPAPAPTALAPSPDAAPVTSAEEKIQIHSANAFTARLYARMKKAPGNTMVSGTSARLALGLTALGARGDTAIEMITTLDLAPERAKQLAAAKAETTAWQEARGTAELVIANRLWSDKRFSPREDFVEAAKDAFGAGIEPVDFLHAPDVARRAINAWVAEKTADKIKDLLAEGMVDKRTRLVVTNAVYFKGRWSTPFAPDATKNEAFTSAPGKKADVPMMHDTAVHAFAQTSDAKMLQMHYSGTDLAMLVVLPNDAAGLGKLEDGITAVTFDSWTKALAPQRVNVSMPRFKFASGGPLDTALQDLGMKSAFTSKADFSGIADPVNGEKLQVSHVVQKTWVAVDENGTEAAAASGVGMSVTSAVMGPIADFKADHPFLFFVYDSKRGRILFAGRVSDPKS